MACRKCGKKTRMPTKVIRTYVSEDADGVQDNFLYRVQARMYFSVGESGIRFLPGERANVVGTLLCQLLTADPSLFIFLIKGEKKSFIAAHPSLRGVV